MNRTHSLVIVSLLVFFATAAAQSSQIKKPETGERVAANNPAAKDPEAERLRLERRAQAESLLISLSTDAGTFKDQMLRARTQAHIADLLWDTDPDRARNLFRKAWDAAEAADAEGLRRMEEDAREQQAKSRDNGYSVVSPPEIRKEVLRLAVKHDRRLGEEFLSQLKEPDESAKDDRNPFRERDPAAAHRVDVAKQLLSDGDTEGALQLASPLLSTVNKQAIDFLTALRDRKPALADEHFASMLSLAAANPRSDINTISLLSSYLLTPHGYGSLIGSGALPIAQTGGFTPPEVAPALRAAFFRLASGILMRPVQSGQDANVLYQYLAIQDFIPWFERFAAPEMTAGLRAQFEVVSSMAPENMRRRPPEPGRDETKPTKPATDPEQSMLDRIDRAKTSAEQDQLYVQLALRRAEAGDLKARDYAGKISETELRQSVVAYINACLAFKAIEKKDAERALEIVRSGELSRLVRVWTMAQAARLLMSAKTDRERVLQVLDDAAAEARRMDGSDPDRPRAFMAVTSAILGMDRTRGWDSMTDAVKAANSAPEFTGADGQLSFRLGGKGGGSMHQHGTEEFNVAGVFKSLAAEDYDRAVSLARVFEHEAPRANAIMAIALTILNENPK